MKSLKIIALLVAFTLAVSGPAFAQDMLAQPSDTMTENTVAPASDAGSSMTDAKPAKASKSHVKKHKAAKKAMKSAKVAKKHHAKKKVTM